jgi:DNA-binding YbaB/EbfC family protein
MSAMLQQAQKMQEDMAALQEDLDNREYDISAGGGAVSLKISGKKQILSLDIDPEIVDPDDIETLSDILIAAVNEAIKRVDDTNTAEMSKITGALGGMPGMPGLF